MLSPEKNSSSRVLPVDSEHQKHLQKKKRRISLIQDFIKMQKKQ